MGLGIEFRWTARFSETVQTDPGGRGGGFTQPPVKWELNLSPGGKGAGAWRWPPTPSNDEVKERIEQYLYSLFWVFMACSRVNFTFTFTCRYKLMLNIWVDVQISEVTKGSVLTKYWRKQFFLIRISTEHHRGISFVGISFV